MTLDEQIVAWALAQSEACKRSLVDGAAAVMPLKPDVIVHGADEVFAPSRNETIMRVASRLSERLDRRPS